MLGKKKEGTHSVQLTRKVEGEEQDELLFTDLSAKAAEIKVYGVAGSMFTAVHETYIDADGVVVRGEIGDDPPVPARVESHPGTDFWFFNPDIKS